MTEHTNKQFDADLESVRSQFLQMGGLVEAMIQEAIDALATGDLSLVDKVREREKEVNRHEVEIDESISRILARHQPTAIDLRMLMAVSKMLGFDVSPVISNSSTYFFIVPLSRMTRLMLSSQRLWPNW